MIRISKLADYATVLMVYMTREQRQVFNAKDLASNTNVPLPTVSKLLKLLAKYGLLFSQRGTHGGYGLNKPAKDISLEDIVAAIDGDTCLTECSGEHDDCDLKSVCCVSVNWQLINNSVKAVLLSINLEAMAKPMDKVMPINCAVKGEQYDAAEC